ncbi:hypothetical protein HID58_049107 [Brassica napus]|uniref:VAN3-binding protein-like auxin canalisation domain-containing protein n=1 Tax=Brassica napus TaxID=3708 RepID=A0ABQ8B408_BRANA|nr:hypothetical protein HID58_049107 [Brassica napus]
MGEDDPHRDVLAYGRGRPAPRSPRPWARTTRTKVTSPMGEDDPHRGHLAHGRGRPAPRSPRPWARMTRAKVTSPMGEDDPHRGHLAHGRGPTSCPETVHPRLSSRNIILGPFDAIPMSPWEMFFHGEGVTAQILGSQKPDTRSLEKKKQETQALNSQIHASVCVAGVDAAVTAIAGATAVSSSSGKDEQMAKPEVAAAATLVVALYMQAAEVIGARAFGLCCQLCHRRSVLLEIS